MVFTKTFKAIPKAMTKFLWFLLLVRNHQANLCCLILCSVLNSKVLLEDARKEFMAA
jgi:hypothetical protein